MLELLAQTAPIIAAALTTLAVAGLRRVHMMVPDQWIPALLPVVSGSLSGLGVALGVEIAPDALSNVDTLTAAVNGIMTGLAAIGVHQVGKRLPKPTATME